MIWDPKLKGFGVRVSKTVKSYIVDYRVDGYQRRATIGRVGEVSLREARARAADLMDSIRHQGRDPLAERQERRDAPTVAEGLDRFFNELVPHRVQMGRMAPTTVSLYRRMSKAIYKRLGKRRIEDVGRKDVQVHGAEHGTHECQPHPGLHTARVQRVREVGMASQTHESGIRDRAGERGAQGPHVGTVRDGGPG